MSRETLTFQAGDSVESYLNIGGGAVHTKGDLISGTHELSYDDSDEGGTSLKAWLSFDSATPSDHSGNNNDGAKNGSISTEDSGILGRDCYTYDGNDDFVSISGGLGLTGSFTVSAYVNSDDISGPPQTIFSQANYSLKEYDDEYILEFIGDTQSWSKSGDVGTSPLGLAVYDGKLYSTTFNSDEIYVFDGTSWSQSASSSDIGTGPQGLAVYDGKLYSTMFDSDEIYVFGEGLSLTADKGSGFEQVYIKKDGDNYEIGKSGSSISTENQSINFNDSGKGFRIGKGWGSSQSGRFGGNNENLQGKIDEFRAYDRALSSSEITDLDFESASNSLKFSDKSFRKKVDPKSLSLRSKTVNVPTNTSLSVTLHRTDGSGNVQESSDAIDLSNSGPHDVTGLTTPSKHWTIELTTFSTSDITLSPSFDDIDLRGKHLKSVFNDTFGTPNKAFRGTN